MNREKEDKLFTVFKIIFNSKFKKILIISKSSKSKSK